MVKSEKSGHTTQNQEQWENISGKKPITVLLFK